jgi:hypothetical protein
MNLEFCRNQDYLLVKISGEWSTAETLKSMDDIKAKSDEYGLKCILLDLLDLSLPDSEMTRFYSGEKIAQLFKYSYKLACFAPAERINHFAEDVAVNRGANFRVFYSEAEAIEWLVPKPKS